MSDSDTERAAGIVLAAGTSTRMGSNKMLLELGGESMIRGAVLRAQMAALSPLIVVVGHEQDLAREALRGLRCDFAVNPDYAGPGSNSLHAGLRALPENVERVIIMLADMVHVTPAMLRALDRKSAGSSAPLVVSRYGDITAPPILYRRALFDELLAWTGEGCGKAVVQAHAHEAEYLEWPADALADVDTPDDFKREKSRESGAIRKTDGTVFI
jgi:molybdenum cofactor cytidylyltransferase